MVEYSKLKGKSGIYFFKNLLNNKYYIGQAVDLNKRLRAHFSHMKTDRYPNIALYKAIKKYGMENFDVDVLEFIDNSLENYKEILDEREKYYIKEYNSYGSTGYNQTLGGDAGVLGYKMTPEQIEKIKQGVIHTANRYKKRIFARNLNKPSWICNITYEDASKISGISIGIIRSICTNRSSHPYSKGWTFGYTESDMWRNVVMAFKDMSIGIYNIHGGRFVKNDPRFQLHSWNKFGNRGHNKG